MTAVPGPVGTESGLESSMLRLLNDHVFFGPAQACKCGWQPPTGHVAAYEHRVHIARLAAALPAPVGVSNRPPTMPGPAPDPVIPTTEGF